MLHKCALQKGAAGHTFCELRAGHVLSRYHHTAAARVKVTNCYRNTPGPAPTCSHKYGSEGGSLPPAKVTVQDH